MSSLQQIAFQEIGETKEKTEQCLHQLREWILGQPHLKNCCRKEASIRLDDPNCEEGTKILLRFLRNGKFDVQKSAHQIDSYLQMKWEFPHWYTGLGGRPGIGQEEGEGERYLELLDNGFIFVSPGRDRKGRKVLINIPRELDPSRHTSADIMKAVMSTIETLLIMDDETQIRGLSYIFYFKGLRFSQVLVWSPSDAAKMLTGCDSNLPIRHRAVVCSDTPFGMGIVIDFGKSFLRQELKSAIQVVSDTTKLRQASDGLFDDPEVLPSDIIGEKDGKYTAREMAGMWKKTVLNHKQQLGNLDELIVKKSGERTNSCADNLSENYSTGAKTEQDIILNSAGDASCSAASGRSWYNLWGSK